MIWEPPTKQFSYIHRSYANVSARESVLHPAVPGVRWKTGYLATEQCRCSNGGTVWKGVSILFASRLYKEDTTGKRHTVTVPVTALTLATIYSWSTPATIGSVKARRNQPDPFSCFIKLHWRARLSEQASVKSSKQSQQASWWQCGRPTLRDPSPGHHKYEPTSPAAALPVLDLSNF
jgi:hypothetical protein